MEGSTLEAIKEIRKISQSDLARMAGVSRQAVSKWFGEQGNTKGGSLSLRISTVQRLAENLGVPIHTLLAPIPHISDASTVDRLRAKYLWDRLYPSILSFSVALIRGELRAIARLVQCDGLFEASKVVGKIIWKRFDDYKKYMPRQRVQQCEIVWKIQKDLQLI